MRNEAEAEIAARAGCDVIDLKEPSRGALGMADPETMAAVARCTADLEFPVPLSVALGDAADWSDERPVPHLARGIAYLKLGTAGSGRGREWWRRWAGVRQRFDATAIAGRESDAEIAPDRAAGRPAWILVAYADWEAADGPAPLDAFEAARRLGCAGILIDTYDKRGGGLFHWMPPHMVSDLAQTARDMQLTLALAGRLQIGDAPRLIAAGSDIVGIRSAACRGGLRGGQIDAHAVRDFRDALRGAPVEAGN